MDPRRGEVVGSVSRLWRYPVKSMLGEEVESAEVVWSGVYGSRCYALVDVESSRLVSAKNPAKWGRMLDCGTRLVGAGSKLSTKGNDGAPPALVVLPDGREFGITDGEYGGAERALSELLGRYVKFTAVRPEPTVARFEHFHAEVEEGSVAGKITEFVRPLEAQAGTFTDVAAVHLVTTATLKALSDLYPGGEFDPLRFRPDFLVDTGVAEGFVESSWVGNTVVIGDDVRLKVFKECGRCVMTTIPQRSLTVDVGVLGTIFRHNRGKTGVYASVLKGGKVKRRDPVSLV